MPEVLGDRWAADRAAGVTQSRGGGSLLADADTLITGIGERLDRQLATRGPRDGASMGRVHQHLAQRAYGGLGCVMIAWGKNKAELVVAAASHSAINVLVSDSEVANELLANHDPREVF